MRPHQEELNIHYVLGSYGDDPFYLGKPDLLRILRFDLRSPDRASLVPVDSDPFCPRPAPLIMFGQVSRANYFLSPYGNYTAGGSKDNPGDVSRTQLKLRLKQPSNPKFADLFAAEWVKYLRTLHFIHRLSYEPEDPSVLSLRREQAVDRTLNMPTILPTPIHDNEVGLSHSLFRWSHWSTGPAHLQSTIPRIESVTSNNRGQQVDMYDNPSDDPLTIEGWPVRGSWRAEMLSCCGDNVDIQPLVAWSSMDYDAVPIEPEEYEYILPDALVLVTLHVICDTVHHSMTLQIAQLIVVDQDPRLLRFARERKNKALASRPVSPPLDADAALSDA